MTGRGRRRPGFVGEKCNSFSVNRNGRGGAHEAEGCDILDSQAEALTQVIEKTANLAFMVRTAIDEARRVQKERQINALQNEALQTLVFLSERPADWVGHVPAARRSLQPVKKLVPVRWLRNQPTAVPVGGRRQARLPLSAPEPVERRGA